MTESPYPSFAALDFEIANDDRSSACAVGVVVIGPDLVLRSERLLLRPPTPRFTHTAIHGIRWEQVANAPTFAEIWPRLSTMLADTRFVAAHNAPFDRSVLRACCARAGVTAPEWEWVDTVQLARSRWALPDHKLPTVAAHLGIPLQHHEPLSDARAAAGIVVAALVEGWRWPPVKHPVQPELPWRRACQEPNRPPSQQANPRTTR